MHYQGKDLLPAAHTLVPPGQERASRSTEPAVLSRSVAVVVRLVRAVSIRSRWAARNPRWLTKSINSHATKREERFLFSRGGTVLVSLTLPATAVILRGNFASHLPLLASTALSPLPLMGKEMLQRNQHNFYWGKAFRSNKSQKGQNHLSYPCMDLLMKDFTSVTRFICTLESICLSGKASRMLLAKPAGNPAPRSPSEQSCVLPSVHFWSPWENTARNMKVRLSGTAT